MKSWAAASTMRPRVSRDRSLRPSTFLFSTIGHLLDHQNLS
jgi:hypothetical protein